MEIHGTTDTLNSLAADAYLIGFFQDRADTELEAWLDSKDLSGVLNRHGFNGKYKEKLVVPFGAGSEVLVAVGLGEVAKFSPERFRNSFAIGLGLSNSHKRHSVVMHLPCVLDNARESVEAAFISEFSLYEFADFKSSHTPLSLSSSLIQGPRIDEEFIKKGQTYGRGANLTKHLANMPASTGTPTYFQETVSKFDGVSLTVFEREDFKKMGFGGLEGVSRGAHEPPKLLVLEYNNSASPDKIMFVGKGITFDSGGISIKPKENLFNLKFDKSGAAAVPGAMKDISDLKMKVNLVELLPLTENMPGGGAYKPGDILKHYNGVTSEIISTDAEGRLVLADAMSYGVEKYRPKALIDIATLTGARSVALGENIAAMFTNNEELQQLVKEASYSSWENVWPMPLAEEFLDQIKSDVADIKNSGGRTAGSETAAAFLSHFTGGTPWVHLDIQGRTVYPQGLSRRDFMTIGASGFGARLLSEIAARFAD